MTPITLNASMKPKKKYWLKKRHTWDQSSKWKEYLINNLRNFKNQNRAEKVYLDLHFMTFLQTVFKKINSIISTCKKLKTINKLKMIILIMMITMFVHIKSHCRLCFSSIWFTCDNQALIFSWSIELFQKV